MIIEILLNALYSIKSNKVRSFLTVLGIVIGISSVIIISSLGEGSKRKINNDLKKLGTNIINIGMSFREKFSPNEVLNERDEPIIKAHPEVLNISPYFDIGGDVENKGEQIKASLIGVNGEYSKIKEISILYGRFLNIQDVKAVSKTVVIDNVFAKELFNRENVVGERITLRTRRASFKFKIIGVYKNANANIQSKFLKNFRPNIYTSIGIVKRILPKKFKINNFTATIKDISKIDQVSSDIVKMLELKHKSTGKYYVENIMKNMEEINSVLNTLTMFTAFVASISLFVGGIGVMNIMLVSVSERTREIGILKSIGASNWIVRTQFLMEAIILSLIGGISGIILGFFTSQVIGKYVKIEPYISLKAVLMTVLISSLVGIIFGVYPANKASKLNPIDALRYE